MIFDQYSRYAALKKILETLGCSSHESLLDVGSGPECLLGSVITDLDITYVDPLIENSVDDRYVNGNVFSSKLDNRSFEVVSAIDVFEHVPTDSREIFLERLSTLAKRYIIIAFPSRENKDASRLDGHVDSEYKEIYGISYPWLTEHFQCGLPSLETTLDKFRNMGWKCSTVGHGYIPWLESMLGAVIHAWDRNDYKKMIQRMSQKFNNELAMYDFSKPYYRDYIIASRDELPDFGSIVVNVTAEADLRFCKILNEFLEEFERSALKYMNSLETKMSADNKMLMVVSDWGKRLELDVLERDKIIIGLNSRIDYASKVMESQQKELEKSQSEMVAKQKELMELSDWASGLHKRIQVIDNSLILYFLERLYHKFYAKRHAAKCITKNLIKRLLPETVLTKYRLSKIKVNFEEVKTSSDITGKVIIAFPIITWGFRFQRPQHILTQLSKKGYTVIYLSLGMVPNGRVFLSPEDAGGNLNFTKLDDNIYKLWMQSYDKFNIYTDQISDENLNNLSFSIQSVIKVLKPKEITYMVQFPGWHRLVSSLNDVFKGKVVFDCMDDHSGFSTNCKELLKDEDKLLEVADCVIASSQLLFDRAIKMNDNTIHVKNGTEFEYFSNAHKNGKLDYLLGKPIIGYYGAISDWFDMEIVEYCARQRPEYNFVMIGSTFGSDISNAKKMANIFFLGEIPYRELVGYFAYFDVCMIPFKLIPLTLATNPVKFYEYLSAGKPVVSVELPELQQYSDCCYLAEDKVDFSSKIDQALLKEPQSLIDNRIVVAKDNSWEKRADAIYNKIK